MGGYHNIVHFNFFILINAYIIPAKRIKIIEKTTPIVCGCASTSASKMGAKVTAVMKLITPYETMLTLVITMNIVTNTMKDNVKKSR